MENFQYHYNEEEEIFYFSWEGETTVQDARDMWKIMIGNNAIPKGCRMMLSDRRNVVLIDKVQNYLIVDDIYRENPEIFKHSKLAVIVNSPTITANFMLLNNRIKYANLNFFSTIEGAKKWLKGGL